MHFVKMECFKISIVKKSFTPPTDNMRFLSSSLQHLQKNWPKGCKNIMDPKIKLG